jgi:hypothetical protein
MRPHRYGPQARHARRPASAETGNADHAGRLKDHLLDHFALPVFMDVVKGRLTNDDVMRT